MGDAVPQIELSCVDLDKFGGRMSWSIYGPVAVSHCSKHASESHPCRVVSVSYVQMGCCHGSVLDSWFLELEMNSAPPCYLPFKRGLNPRFPPTILVSFTISQVLRRPPEVT